MCSDGKPRPHPVPIVLHWDDQAREEVKQRAERGPLHFRALMRAFDYWYEGEFFISWY